VINVDSSAGSQTSALVVGATGMQGGAVSRAMRKRGIDVTALVRDQDCAPSQVLVKEGIRLVTGDLDDPATLAPACAGHTAVFSVQLAPTRDQDSERRQGENLVKAARNVGVSHLLHTSVSGTGWREAYPDVDPGVMRNYWQSKEDVEAMVRDAGFPIYTIFKPAFFMENFIAPKSAWMFPLLTECELLVACRPTTKLGMISADDFGVAVATAVVRPQEFVGAEIELGSDALTFPEIAEIITAVAGRSVTASCRPVAEVDARLGRRSWSATMLWLDVVGYPAGPADAEVYSLRMQTSFAQWAEQHRAELIAAIEQ
jgi:uncharacterized protein YbjT (DUF2867 family)